MEALHGRLESQSSAVTQVGEVTHASARMIGSATDGLHASLRMGDCSLVPLPYVVLNLSISLILLLCKALFASMV